MSGIKIAAAMAIGLLLALSPVHGAAPVAADQPQVSPGRALYAEHCAACHEGGVQKAPHREFLQGMSPAAILNALNAGAMKSQAAALSPSGRRQVVEYLTGRDLAQYRPPPAPVMCTGAARKFDLASPAQPVGWGHDTGRFIPNAAAGFTAGEVPRLKLKWAFDFPESQRARSQPAIALGAVFVGSQSGNVYALDLKSGCTRWINKGSAEVRTGIVVESGRRARPRLFFGDFIGRVHALDALTGKTLWITRADDHPNTTITGTPLIKGGTVYVPVSALEVVTAADPAYACCTFRGSLVALDARTGVLKWRHYTVDKVPSQSGVTAVGTARIGPSGAPVWGSPAFDAARGVIYHGSGENFQSPADGNSDALFAVDARTGARRWVFQLTANDAWNVACMLKDRSNCPLENGPDHDVGAPPLLVPLTGGAPGAPHDIVVVGQKSGMVYGVDPDSGKPVWSARIGRGGVQGGIHFGMAAEGSVVFVGVNDVPMLADGSRASGAGTPGLVALDARTGMEVWRTIAPDLCAGKANCNPGISAAVTAMPGVVFAGHLDGRLRAYASGSGKILWETKTDRVFKSVNGRDAKGGSFGGPGVAIGSGYLVTNSGYGFSDHMPGNALLAFDIDGK
jgi:polyvinyl alcohol dehydrogenase (cytochrome)